MKYILIITFIILSAFCTISYAVVPADPIDFANSEIVWSGRPLTYFVYGQTAWDFYKECTQLQDSSGCNIVVKAAQVAETKEQFEIAFILIREL
jgi:hypothetical protein